MSQHQWDGNVDVSETKREVGVLPEGSCCVRLTAEAVEGEKET